MLRSMSVNSPGNAWSQPDEEKVGYTVGRICRIGKFSTWSERANGNG